MNGFGPWPREENLDTWNEWGGLKHCSFCGSLNPETLLDLMEQGKCTLGPTDKSYKVYVDTDGNRNLKFYFQHLSEDQRDKFIEIFNKSTNGTAEHQFKVGYPGYFYVLPFFCAKREVKSADADLG